MEKAPIYSHNPYQAESFPLLVLDVKGQICTPYNEGFRVLHWHEELQFVHVKSGKVHVQIYEEEIDLAAGDCLFINRSVLHHIMEKEPCAYHSYLIPEKMLSFFPGSTMEHSDVTPIAHNSTFTHYLLTADESSHTAVFQKLQKLEELYFQDTLLSHREYRLCLALTSFWLEFISLLPTMSELPPSKDYERIRTFISYIHSSYSKPVSVEDIALSAHVSKTECLRCFQKFVGCSPYQYLLRYRLHMSTSLLRRTSLTVTEIALQCGFSSASSYIQYFKKHYGKTPQQYRS